MYFYGVNFLIQIDHMAVGPHQRILLESLQRFLVVEILFLYFHVCSILHCSISLILFDLNLE